MFHVKRVVAKPFVEILSSAPHNLSPSQIATMDAHWSLVKAWSRRINLTTIATDVDAAWMHYRDALEALPYLPAAGQILDIGSGAGFPGIPLAIACPHLRFSLMEPRQKRVSFLRQAIFALSLDNARVLPSRSTDAPSQFDAAVTRATFSQPTALLHALTWLHPRAPLIAFRAPPPIGSAQNVHVYRLRKTNRLLEIWRRP